MNKSVELMNYKKKSRQTDCVTKHICFIVDLSFISPGALLLFKDLTDEALVYLSRNYLMSLHTMTYRT